MRTRKLCSVSGLSRVAGTALAILFLCGLGVAQEVDESAAHRLFELLNQERDKAGLAALHWDERLAQAAVDHSKLLAEYKRLSHQFEGEPALRQRLAKYDLRLNRSGENVAYDNSIGSAHTGLMQSPRHRDNIMSPNYNAAGIGVVKRGNLYYVTQNFAHRLPELAIDDVERRIAASVAKLRQQQGLRRLARVENAGLRSMACQMAVDDQLQPRLAQGLPGARHFIAYTMTDPETLPEQVLNLRTASSIDRFGVGACFERSATYPNGVYWVMLVFMQSGDARATGS